MLHDDGRRITIELPLSYDGGFNAHHSWFENGFKAVRSSTLERPDTPAPRTVIFVDHIGTVVLNDCRWGLASLATFGGAGQIVASHAIMNANHFGYPLLHGMRSEIRGLGDWVGHSGLSIEVTRSDLGEADSITISTTPPEPIALARTMNLKIVGSWRTVHATDGIGVEAPMQLISQVQRPRHWSEHQELHSALLELMELSSWTRIGFRRVEVTRLDDPERSVAGNPLFDRWCEVRSHARYFSDGDADAEPRFLFLLRDIGTSGFRRWLRLRGDFARGLQQLHAMLRQPGMYGEVQIINTGTALESIGYVLAREAGKSEASAARETYVQRLERMLEVIPEQVLGSDWITRSRASFISAKHIDAAQPANEDLARALRENILAIRYWLGKRLGASDPAMQPRLPFDRVGRHLS